MEQLIVDAGLAGQRLDKLLRKYMPLAGSGFVYKMLRKKNITLNGKKANGSESVLEGDIIRLFLSQDTITQFQAADKAYDLEKKAYSTLEGIQVLYEDQDALIVHKPAGILSQKSQPQDVSLNEWLVGYLLGHQEISREELGLFRPSVCNRLDRNTSGIVLCGKSLKGSQELSRLIRTREIRKFYKTLVWGRLEKGRRLEGYLVKDEKKNKVYISSHPDSEGQTSAICTVYKPLSYVTLPGRESWEMTCLEVELITGKSHQIRAHLASIGHPLVGDGKYASPEAASPNRYMREKYGVVHQLLHSCRIHFPAMSVPFQDWNHLSVTAPLPPILQQLTGGF